jgi:regulator of sirC expression with transglutaminase-like and TPR domain
MVSKFYDRSFLRSAIFRGSLLLLLVSPVIGQDDNSSTLSELELAKRDAEDFEKLAKLVKPSVVVIESVDRLGREGGRGTGFVVRGDGVIATNFHVIGEHRDFAVRFADGKTFRPQSILAVDRDRDLALIKIDAKNLPALELGDSDKIDPGQAVFALGNPLGYSHSVSRGVVAAIRELEDGDGRPMVQVAIPIEPGSSGSPTLDLEGRVIAILAIKSGGAMGFGIPSNSLQDLLSKQNPIPMKKWLTIGALDELEWESVMAGSWKQRAGIITASGLGSGFGGRMLCLSHARTHPIPYELEVEVRLADESGAAGLVFHGDGKDQHYGFYPTNGSLRLTRFEGPNVFSWTILKTLETDAYRPGEWNRLRVRLEKEGRIICSVNDQVLIDLVDQSLKNGRIGLCKFRLPTAEFRKFRHSKRFPQSSISPALVKKIRRLSSSLNENADPSKKDLKDLVNQGPMASQALIDHAGELERKAGLIRKLSEEIRERIVIADLASSLAHEDERSVDLLKSALLIARLDNEDFDLESYLRKTERIAEKIEGGFPEKASGEEKLKSLVFQLFQEMGFHGSTLDYNHRSNSYLNEVIDDREGLPITLSVLFIELANRLDLPVSGLGLPGHFITMYREPTLKDSNMKGKEILVDPFGGKIVSRKDAADLTGYRLTDDDFKPAQKKEIISRMLRNLIRSAEQDRDAKARLRYLDALLAINPKDNYMRAMRAMILYAEGRFARALEDIDLLIKENPESPETAPLMEIRERLIEQDPQRP